MVNSIMALIVIITSKLGLANALESALLSAGYKTLVASDGKQAIDLMAGQSPALILLGETEQSLVHEASILRANLLTRQVPIMLQSNNYYVHSLAYQQRLGVQAALSSPYTASHLLNTVKEWVPVAS